MMFGIVPRLKAQVLAIEFIQKNTALYNLLDHPAGPFTIHFWAPTCKYFLFTFLLFRRVT